MGNKRLYTLDISEDALTRGEDRTQRQLQRSGTVTQSAPAVESITTEPGERLLRGEFRGEQDDMATLMAAEVEDLFDSQGIEAVPFYDVVQATEQDGYFSLENVTTGSPDPRLTGASSFDGRLIHVGSRSSQFRAVEISESGVTSPFGSGTVPVVAPAEAARVQWYDRRSKASKRATPTDTAAAQFGGVQLFDPDDAPYADAGLAYSVPYAEDGATDVRVYDDYDRTQTATQDAVDGSSTFGGATFGTASFGGETTQQETVVGQRWRQVFRTAHEFVGSAVLRTGRLSLTVDEAAGTLRAARWSETDGRYNSVELGTSDWRLWDLDLRRIGQARIRAEMAFRRPSDGRVEPVQVVLYRGLDSALVYRRDGAPPLPSGLQTLLDPVALDADVDPSPTKTLVARTEVE